MQLPTLSSQRGHVLPAESKGPIPGRRSGRSRRAARVTALTVVCTALVAIGASSPVAGAAGLQRHSDLQPAYQNLGTWVPLDMSGNAQGNTPAVFETSGADAYDLWLDKIHGAYTYEVAELGPDGGVLAPAASIFGSRLSSFGRSRSICPNSLAS